MKIEKTDVKKGTELAASYGLTTAETWARRRDKGDWKLNWGYLDAVDDITNLIGSEFQKAATPDEFAENMKHFIIERKLFSRHANHNFEAE